MTKVGTMKSIPLFLIVVITTNAALTFTARHALANLAKIHHSGKKKTANLITDDHDPDSDFKAAFYPAGLHTKRQYNSISAMITVCTILTPLINNGTIPINTSQRRLNSTSSIFIPPEPSL